MVTQQLEKTLEGLVVLIADPNPYLRRLTRMMLTNLGIKSIYESVDGIAALDAIRNIRSVRWTMYAAPAPSIRSSSQSRSCAGRFW